MSPDLFPQCESAVPNWALHLPSAAPQPPAGLHALPRRLRLEPETVRNGVAQLVLTLIELIRELLERQGIRRIDAGSLTDDEVERMGLTFCRLAEEIERLKQYFGFSDEDLNLDLGPLGTLR